MKIITILVLVMLMPGFVFANSTAFAPLLTSSNDDNNIESHLGLKLNARGDILKLVEKSFQAGVLTKTVEYSINQIISGLVMYKKKGRDIVDLQSDNLSSHNGGNLNLNYLYNGITGSYCTEELNLVRTGNRWSIEFEGRKITHAHFYLHIKRVFGTVGISHVNFR